jgi:hypothetical protein
MWQLAATLHLDRQRSSLLFSILPGSTCAFVQCIYVNIRTLLTTFQKGAKTIFLRLAGTHRMYETWSLQLEVVVGFTNSTRTREVTGDSCQIK